MEYFERQLWAVRMVYCTAVHLLLTMRQSSRVHIHFTIEGLRSGQIQTKPKKTLSPFFCIAVKTRCWSYVLRWVFSVLSLRDRCTIHIDCMGRLFNQGAEITPVWEVSVRVAHRCNVGGVFIDAGVHAVLILGQSLGGALFYCQFLLSKSVRLTADLLTTTEKKQLAGIKVLTSIKIELIYPKT